MVLILTAEVLGKLQDLVQENEQLLAVADLQVKVKQEVSVKARIWLKNACLSLFWFPILFFSLLVL